MVAWDFNRPSRLLNQYAELARIDQHIVYDPTFFAAPRTAGCCIISLLPAPAQAELNCICAGCFVMCAAACLLHDPPLPLTH
jgi:hypothetical protein